MKHVWVHAPFSNKRFYSRHICSYQRPNTFLAVKVNSFTLATQETSRQSNEGRSHRWTDARHRAVIEIHERGECKLGRRRLGGVLGSMSMSTSMSMSVSVSVALKFNTVGGSFFFVLDAVFWNCPVMFSEHHQFPQRY